MSKDSEDENLDDNSNKELEEDPGEEVVEELSDDNNEGLYEKNNALEDTEASGEEMCVEDGEEGGNAPAFRDANLSVRSSEDIEVGPMEYDSMGFFALGSLTVMRSYYSQFVFLICNGARSTVLKTKAEVKTSQKI